MAGILWSSSNPQIEFDALLDKTTSDLLPAQTPVDLVACLQLADMIRSSAVQPVAACKSIQKRLKHDNPNVQLLALDVLDICIKNGGTPFLLQAGSKDLASDIETLGRGSNAQVREKALKDLQDWAGAFLQKPSLSDTELVRTYERMKANGTVQFPPKDASATAAMVDSLSAPEWTDAPYCTRCRTEFSTFNRKHHCRNCGQVFDQACSSSTAALPHYGILQPVRVCDGCLKKIKEGKGASVITPSSTNTNGAVSKSSSGVKRSKSRRQQEEEDLERAIAASLQEPEPQQQKRPAANASGYNTSYSRPAATRTESGPVSQEDADLAAAIAASLRDVAAAPTAPAAVAAETYADLYPRYETNERAPSPERRPRITTLPSYDLTPSEQSAIDTFSQTFLSQHHRPTYVGYRERGLYEDAARAQPRLERGIEDAHRRRDMLIEMNRKLAEATRMYEHLLDARLEDRRPAAGVERRVVSDGYPMTNGANTYSAQPAYYQHHQQEPNHAYQMPAPNPGQPLPHFDQHQQQLPSPVAYAPPPSQNHPAYGQPTSPTTAYQQQQQHANANANGEQPAGWYKASSFPAAPKAPILPTVPHDNPWQKSGELEDEEEEEEQQQPVGELIEL